MGNRCGTSSCTRCKRRCRAGDPSARGRACRCDRRTDGGHEAARAAQIARETVLEAVGGDIIALAHRCHRALASTRGAAVAFAGRLDLGEHAHVARGRQRRGAAHHRRPPDTNAKCERIASASPWRHRAPAAGDRHRDARHPPRRHTHSFDGRDHPWIRRGTRRFRLVSADCGTEFR